MNVLYFLLTISLSISVSCYAINDTINYDLYKKIIGDGILHQLGDLLEKDPSLVNGLCSKDILLWKISSPWKKWALKMTDANAKFPTGLMSLNFNSLGQYDQCLGVKHEVFNRQIKGKYCSAKLPLTDVFSNTESNDINVIHNYYSRFLENTNERLANVDHYGRLAISIGICIPDSCSGKDIENLIQNFLKNLGITLEKPLIAVPEAQCHNSDLVKFTAENWIGISILTIFVIILLISTVYDLYANFIKKEKPKYHTVLSSFSVYSNTNRLMTINSKSGSLRCIHGIRVLSLFWIILGHRYSTSLVMPMVNTIDFIKWNNSFASMMILAGSVAVDTFFVLSGLLVAYVLFQQLEKNKSFNLPLYYLHRIIRLTPAFAAVILFTSTLYELMGDGPLWSHVNFPIIKTCQKYWWTAILYVQNYVNPEAMCVSQTWYLCIDVQLYILSPILIYPLIKNKTIGIINLITWIIIAQLTVTIIVFLHEWPAAAVSFKVSQDDYMKKYYNATHMRATPWLLGFATGYALSTTSKKSYRFNPAVVTSLWITSLVVIAAIIFGFLPIQATNHEVSHLDGAYSAFARTAWSLAIIWIIIACVHGYGGPINWFLSLRCWEILGRLSYSMYLIHPPIQVWITGSARATEEFSQLVFVYLYFGDLIMVGLLSYIWVLAFESPFIILEKAAFHTEKPQVQHKDLEAKD